MPCFSRWSAAVVVAAAATAARAEPSAAEGLHLAVGAGAGFAYDGVAGLRLQGRYGHFALSLGLGRDALPSDQILSDGHGVAHGAPFHSLAGSLQWIRGGDHGLVLSLTLWGQWESTRAATLPEPHSGDRWVILMPAAGWRWAAGPVYFEASLGLPYSWTRYTAIDDEPPFLPVVERRSGLGWSGCGRCDLMKSWPSAELGLGWSL